MLKNQWFLGYDDMKSFNIFYPYYFVTILYLKIKFIIDRDQ